MGDKAAQEGTLLDDFVYPGGGDTPRGAFRKASPRRSLLSCCVKDTGPLQQSHPPEPFHRSLSIQSYEPALLGAAHLGGASCLKVQIQ